MPYTEKDADRLRAETRRTLSVFDGIIIGIAAISLARGVTSLEDIHIFPDEKEKSAWASIALGLVLLWMKGDDIKNALNV